MDSMTRRFRESLSAIGRLTLSEKKYLFFYTDISLSAVKVSNPRFLTFVVFRRSFEIERGFSKLH